MVIDREYPVLLKEEFMVSQVLRRSKILFWSGDGRGDSQWYCRRVYLGVAGVVVILDRVVSLIISEILATKSASQ